MLQFIFGIPGFIGVISGIGGKVIGIDLAGTGGIVGIGVVGIGVVGIGVVGIGVVGIGVVGIGVVGIGVVGIGVVGIGVVGVGDVEDVEDVLLRYKKIPTIIPIKIIEIIEMIITRDILFYI